MATPATATTAATAVVASTQALVDEIMCAAQLPTEVVLRSVDLLETRVKELNTSSSSLAHSADYQQLRCFGSTLWNFTTSKAVALSQRHAELRVRLRAAASSLYQIGCSDPHHAVTKLKTHIELVKMLCKTGRDWIEAGNVAKALTYLRAAHAHSAKQNLVQHIDSDNSAGSALGELFNVVLSVHTTCSSNASNHFTLLKGMVLPSDGPLGHPVSYVPTVTSCLVDRCMNDVIVADADLSLCLLQSYLTKLRRLESGVSHGDDNFWRSLARLHVAVAEAQLQRSNIDGARENLQRALALRPSPEAHLSMCAMLLHANDGCAALDQLEVFITSGLHLRADAERLCALFRSFCRWAGTGEDQPGAKLSGLVWSQLSNAATVKRWFDCDMQNALGEIVLAVCDVQPRDESERMLRRITQSPQSLESEEGEQTGSSDELCMYAQLIPSLRQKILYFAWDVATKRCSWEAENQRKAWFYLCLALAQLGASSSDAAMIQRSIARHHLKHNELDDASIAVEGALAIDPRSIHAVFIKSQILIERTEYGAAESLLKCFPECEPRAVVPHMFSLIAKFCHERRLGSLCCTALEALVRTSGAADALPSGCYALMLRNYVQSLSESRAGPTEDYCSKLLWAGQLYIDAAGQTNIKNGAENSVALFDDVMWWVHTLMAAAGRHDDASLFALAANVVQMLPETPHHVSLYMTCFLGEALLRLSPNKSIDDSGLTPQDAKAMLSRVAEAKILFYKYQHSAADLGAEDTLDLLALVEIGANVAAGTDGKTVASMCQALHAKPKVLFDAVGLLAARMERGESTDASYVHPLRLSVEAVLRSSASGALPLASPSQVLCLYRILLEFTPTHDEELDILQRAKAHLFRQCCENDTDDNNTTNNDVSLSQCLNRDDVQWLVARAWNAGVYAWQLRRSAESLNVAEAFLSLACDVATKLGYDDGNYAELFPQYQAVVKHMRQQQQQSVASQNAQLSSSKKTMISS
eukprot:PhM_4_TR17198/c0_g1_i1/m.105946